MHVSYRALIADHVQIDRLVRLLDDDVAMLDADDADRASGHVRMLSDAIRRHLAAEREVLAIVEGKGLTGEWGGRWAGIVARIDRLDRDWTRFSDDWREQAIRADWPGFGAAVRAFSRRLFEENGVEIDVFYAKALEAGAVSLI